MKKCSKCGEVKPSTSEHWVVYSGTCKKSKEYPEWVGRPYGACRSCRNKAESARQKEPSVKDKRAKLYSKWGNDYSILRNVQNKKNRAKTKKDLIDYKGGKCEKCGYDNPVALQFHHKDPSEKDFTILSTNRNVKLLFEEADKCMLLCANCHFELHAEQDQQKLDEQIEYLKTTKYKDHKHLC